MYQALYRKQRPKDFTEIVGQDHIVRTLQNQISANRVSHAYLFCGTRGTGKTSSSLVFSKALNCLSPINNNPCNNCDSCNQINNGNSMDVFEIDAASNNGVDNIRDIKDEINYPPTVSKYKIYIIDEVHMLSTGAFNALLKTLEEPPEHAIFILATTDPQKLPQTILSRCQRYDFKRIKAPDMKETLLSVCENENREVEVDAISYICSVSDGAMRDALSLLDQAFSFFFEGVITLDNILELVGSVDKKVFFDFTNALIKFDSIELLKIINDLVMNSSDITQFVTEEIRHLRDVLVAKSDATNSLSYSMEHIEKLVEQSKNAEQLQIIFYIEEFSSLLSDLKASKNQRILLETAVLKLCNALIYKDNEESVILRIKKLENTIENLQKEGVKVVENTPTNKNINIEEEQKEEIKITKAIPADIMEVKKNWANITAKMDMSTSAFFKVNVKVGYIDDDILYLVCNSNAQFYRKRSDALNQILLDMYHKEFNVQFVSIEEYDKLHKDKYSVNGEFVNDEINGLKEKLEKFDIAIEVEDF